MGFRGILAWARWEFSRRIEVTLGLRLIVLDRAVKAIALTLGGIVLLVTVHNGALEAFADRLQTDLNVQPGSHLWLRLTNYAVGHFTALGPGAQVALAIAVFLYGLLEAVEGIGIVLRRRWAEYLVLLGTLAFIPLELDELLVRPAALKGLAFVINVAIAVYLIWRKRLFLDRPLSRVSAPAVRVRR